MLGSHSRNQIGPTVTRRIHTATGQLNCQPGPLTHSLHADGAHVLNFVDRRVTTAPRTNKVVLNTRSTTDGLKCVLLAIGASNGDSRTERVTALGHCKISKFLCTGVSGHFASIPGPLRSCPLILISTASHANQCTDVRPSRALVNCSTAGQLVSTYYTDVTCVNYSRPVLTRRKQLRKCHHTLLRTNVPFSRSLIITIPGGKPTLRAIASLFRQEQPSKCFYFGSTHT